jgi:hypothetical protein
MLARLKRSLGANGPGITIAVLAMLVALTGGAFAASGALTGKQKKEVEKIAKKSAGKPGAQGATGATGAKGDKGDAGGAGAAGVEGKPGKSVKVTSIASGNAFECEEQGGALVEEEGAVSGTEVCNGKTGFTAVLPPGEIETGTWAFTGSPADTSGVPVSISFAIPLAARLHEEDVHFQEEDEETFVNACGTTGSTPTPIPGVLCVYRSLTVEGTTFEGIFPAHTVIFPNEPEAQGTSKQGAVLLFGPPSAVTSNYGTFAVRAAGP